MGYFCFMGGPAQSRTGNTGFGGPDYIHLTTGPLLINREKFSGNRFPLSGIQKDRKRGCKSNVSGQMTEGNSQLCDGLLIKTP